MVPTSPPIACSTGRPVEGRACANPTSRNARRSRGPGLDREHVPKRRSSQRRGRSSTPHDAGPVVLESPAHPCPFRLHMDGAPASATPSVKNRREGPQRNYAPPARDSLWLDYTKGLGAGRSSDAGGAKALSSKEARAEQNRCSAASMRQRSPASHRTRPAASYALEPNWDRLAEEITTTPATLRRKPSREIKGLEKSTCRAWSPNPSSSMSINPVCTAARLVMPAKERGQKICIGSATGPPPRDPAPSPHLDRPHRWRTIDAAPRRSGAAKCHWRRKKRGRQPRRPPILAFPPIVSPCGMGSLGICPRHGPFCPRFFPIFRPLSGPA